MPRKSSSATTTEIRRDALEAGLVDLSDVVEVGARPIAPVPPGAFLREEFLEPLGLTAYRLAKSINVPLTRIAAILSGDRGITADTALRLARFFGTSAEFWLNIQQHYDLARARRAVGKSIDREIEPLSAAN